MQKAASNPSFLDFRYIPHAFSNNPKYDYLWMMKYYFMNDAYNRGLLSEQVVWIDFGFDHGGLRYYSEDFDLVDGESKYYKKGTGKSSIEKSAAILRRV